MPLGTGHNLAGGVGRWKQWAVTYFLARKKGGLENIRQFMKAGRGLG
jgi:hypothetical protein